MHDRKLRANGSCVTSRLEAATTSFLQKHLNVEQYLKQKAITTADTGNLSLITCVRYFAFYKTLRMISRILNIELLVLITQEVADSRRNCQTFGDQIVELCSHLGDVAR